MKDDINENLALSDLSYRIKSGEKIVMETQNFKRNLLRFIPRISSSKFFTVVWASRSDSLFGIIQHILLVGCTKSQENAKVSYTGNALDISC